MAKWPYLLWYPIKREVPDWRLRRLNVPKILRCELSFETRRAAARSPAPALSSPPPYPLEDNAHDPSRADTSGGAGGTLPDRLVRPRIGQRCALAASVRRKLPKTRAASPLFHTSELV